MLKCSATQKINPLFPLNNCQSQTCVTCLIQYMYLTSHQNLNVSGWEGSRSYATSVSTVWCHRDPEIKFTESVMSSPKVSTSQYHHAKLFIMPTVSKTKITFTFVPKTDGAGWAAGWLNTDDYTHSHFQHFWQLAASASSKLISLQSCELLKLLTMKGKIA